MNVKTIDIDEETYNKLLSVKKNDETIADVVKRLLKNKKEKSLLNFAGIWDFTEEEWKKLQQALDEFGSQLDDML
ncbi:MAG: antitoxin VapB family protein [Candidatus Heimdallarchaeota archaeon]|nr:antitoxin VapB family protein [Candidatus Heimdallarchaeota archaeon]